MPLCEYGCGREATHQFKNGKWACSNKWSKCPAKKKKREYKYKQKPHFEKNSHNICRCGKIANWHFSYSDSWWCSDNVMKCESVAKKMSNIITEIWKSPQQRQKYIEALNTYDKSVFKIAFNKPEIRENRKRIMIERYKDPNERQKQSKIMIEVLKDEEIKEKSRIASKLKWKDPVCAKKMASGIKKSWDNNPERKNESSKRLKEKWTPEKRKQVSEEWKNGFSAYASSFITNPSKPQIKLWNMVQEITPLAILNYPCFWTNKSIDIVVPHLSIAIEFDGSYWHQNNEKDTIRQKLLEEQGWIFIRYVDKIPTKKQLIKDINEALNEMV